MSQETHKFSSKFPPVNDTDWRDLTEKFIKGADFDDTLVRRTEDDIAKGPLFSANDIENSAPVLRSEQPHLDGRPWHIGALVDYPDIKTANLDLLEELKGGASCIVLELGTQSKNGVQIRTKSDVERLFSGVFTNLVPINVLPSHDNFEVAAVLAAHFKTSPNIKDIHVSLGYAPLQSTKNIGDICNWVRSNIPHWKALSVNARAVHEAGGTPAQELAYMLQMACTYIRAMLKADLSIDEAVDLMDVYLASDQDGHQDIVKLRAAHLLLGNLTDGFNPGGNNNNWTINAVSSNRMMAAQDPWSNMIRLNSACFGAICGGADTITLLPFTEAIGLATPFAKRMSRNLQLMMMEESHLGQVYDPTSGSFMHEKLTNDLAQKAWDLFQTMQSQTEPTEWLENEITVAREMRETKIENDEILLVGVNQFAKPDVRKAEVRKPIELKPRKGELIAASSFTIAVDQANNGRLTPPRGPQKIFKPIRISEKFDNAGIA